jgi:Bacterial regulatory proteins, tetR family
LVGEVAVGQCPGELQGADLHPEDRERVRPSRLGVCLVKARRDVVDDAHQFVGEDLSMRYGKDHKQATRQRIVEAAGRRFKQDGIDGAGVAAVMSDARLTNGAFYAHFTSKEDLVANVLADQLRAQRQSLDVEAPDRAGLEAFVRSYLSPQHRDQCADGCPSAALLDEIACRPAATRNP